jgi:hypothetical protein
VRVIIAGGRDFSDYERLSERVLHLLSAQDQVTIVCGEARGADSLGKRLAYEKGWEVLSFPADWDKYGKAAGYKRNEEMARNADALIAFWDGKSKGTKHMIDLAKKHGLQTRIVGY